MKKLIIALGLMVPFIAQAETTWPTQFGQCAITSISEISYRLVDGNTGVPIPDTGSAVFYSNGHGQVSYEDHDAISKNSTIGDAVLVCLVFIPRNCPSGDDRGKVYTTTNLRTLGSWTLGETQHGCGGA